MKKTVKSVIGIILCVLTVCSCSVGSFAMDSSEWNKVWTSSEKDNAVTMYVGSNESERNFVWYSEKSKRTPVVILGENENLSDGKVFEGTCTDTPQNDRANYVTVTGLKADTVYYYQCKSGDFASGIYSFKTAKSDSFSAIYVTDVHISKDKFDDLTVDENLSATALKLNNVLENAVAQNSDVSVLLSAGDQGTNGLRCEYTGFTASPVLNGIAVATAIGNHDKKGVDYKYFNNVPNEYDGQFSQYIGGDYWFRQNNVLFLVYDSNCPAGTDHESFTRNAVEQNSDAKFRVAMFHHDLYGQRISHRESENKQLRLIFVPILDEFKIDIALLGHSHYWTQSNAVYDGETVQKLEDNNTDLKGTVYLVSGSINNARSGDDEDELPLGENIARDVITDETLYNILTFTENSVTVKSYSYEKNECFSSFTINKTSNDGGHKTNNDFFVTIKNVFVRFISSFVSIFTNMSVYNKLKEKGFDVDFFEVVFN